MEGKVEGQGKVAMGAGREILREGAMEGRKITCR